MHRQDWTGTALVPNISTPQGLSLMPHQRDAVYRALRARQYLIAHEQGTGKTITGIMLAQSLIANGVRPVLVICPPSLRVNWANEFAKWAPHLSIAQLKTKRPLDLPDAEYAGLPDADIILATDGTLAGFVNWYIGGVRPFTWDDLKKPKYDDWGNVIPPVWFNRDFGAGVGGLIVDECQRVSSTRGTARTGAYMTLGQARAQMPKFALSGTPFTKSRVALRQLLMGMNDLWSRHAHKVGEEMVLCDDSQDWLDWFAPVAGAYGARGVANTEQLHDEMFDAVRGWAHRVRTADVITDLPDGGRITQDAEMSTGDWASKYAHAERDLASWLTKQYGWDKADRMMRAEALARLQELRRLVGRAKMDAVVEQVSLLLDVPEGEDAEQVLVMCNHTDVREHIIRALEKTHRVGTIHGSMTAEAKQKVVDAWQNHELDVVVANVISASVGFTMTAGRHIVFAEVPWNASDLLQAESRLLRLGQERTVVSTVLLGTKRDGARTVDHDLWRVVQAKFAEARGVLDGEYDADLTAEEEVSIAERVLRAIAERHRK